MRNPKPSRRKQGKTAPRTRRRRLGCPHCPWGSERAHRPPVRRSMRTWKWSGSSRLEALKALSVAADVRGRSRRRGHRPGDRQHGGASSEKTSASRGAYCAPTASASVAVARSCRARSSGSCCLAFGGERSRATAPGAEAQSVPAPPEPEQVETSPTDGQPSRPGRHRDVPADEAKEATPGRSRCRWTPASSATSSSSL